MTIFPTDYTTKATPDGTDVVWSSDAVTNFNLTIASIALYTLTNADTDSLSEGATNLYYTDARADARVAAGITGKEDVANKSTNMATDTGSNTKYPSVSAVENYVANAGTNINGLTEKTTLTNADEFIISDSEDSNNNKKINYLDLFSQSFNIVSGDNLLAASTTPDSAFNTTYTKVKEISVNLAGTYKVEYDLSTPGAGDPGIAGRIYINGVAVGTENELNGFDQNQTFVQDFTVSANDLIQLYIRQTDTSGGSNQFLNVKFNTVSSLLQGTVNL